MEITDEALRMVEEMPDQDERFSNVLFKSEWHKGVIGIVASRVIEQHYKPTIILAESKGMATGSARSVKGYNVYEAILSCSDLLERFGGHKYAAGLTMRIENIEAFRNRFEAYVRDTMPAESRVPSVGVDMHLPIEGVSDRFVNILEAMAPFGPQNMRPVFMASDLLAEDVRIVGENHLKFHVKDAGGRKAVPAIAFKQAEQRELVMSGAPFSMLFVLEFNEWRGNRTVQLNVKDIKPGKVSLDAGDGVGSQAELV